MKVESNVAALSDELDKRMKAAVMVIGGMAETHAKDNAPYDTGLLKNSITHGSAGGQLAATSYTSDTGAVGEYASSSVPEDANGNAYVVVVGTNVEYAPFQELGTIHMEPHAFLRPAFEDHAAEYKQALQQILKNGV